MLLFLIVLRLFKYNKFDGIYKYQKKGIDEFQILSKYYKYSEPHETTAERKSCQNIFDKCSEFSRTYFIGQITNLTIYHCKIALYLFYFCF